MTSHRRFLLVSALTLAVAAATGCGGVDPADAPPDALAVDAGSSTDANAGGKKGGGTNNQTVAMQARPDPVAFGETMTVSLYPGSLFNQQLFINWICSTLGTSGRSWELGYGVANEPGYAWVNDHYEWTFVMIAPPMPTTGPTTCVAKGLIYTSRTGYSQVGQVSFTVQ